MNNQKWKPDIPELRKPKPPEYKVPEVPENVKLTDRQIVFSELDRLWLNFRPTAMLMGTINFISSRLTGFRFFKDKIGVKDDQSLWGRLIELINIIITKLKGTKS